MNNKIYKQTYTQTNTSGNKPKNRLNTAEERISVLKGEDWWVN